MDEERIGRSRSRMRGRVRHFEACRRPTCDLSKNEHYPIDNALKHSLSSWKLGVKEKRKKEPPAS